MYFDSDKKNHLFLPRASVEHIKTCDVGFDTVFLHNLRFPKLCQRYESCSTKLNRIKPTDQIVEEEKEQSRKLTRTGFEPERVTRFIVRDW